MQNTISVCIIAKNEANFIKRCIQSVLPYADQVVVVDTGSSDNTPAIAKELGAEVWHFTWNNDFSAARNFSLSKAWGQWILYIDCDEEIDPETGNELLTAVQNNNFDAYFIKVRNMVHNDEATTFTSIRLFRNYPQFRFEGKIHEQISKSILNHSSMEKVGQSDLTLIHHGYNPEMVNIKAKVARNMKLLQQQASNDIQDGFLYYNIGIEYVRQKKFNQALENFIRSLELSQTNTGYAPMLVNKIVTCLIELNRYRDAIQQLDYYRKIYPNYRELYLLEAVCHMKCGRYSQAYDIVSKLNLAPEDNLHYFYSNKVYGYSADELQQTLKDLRYAKGKNFSLTVCILMTDEQCNISNCINSISELADEILVLTVGCQDSALMPAYQMGAKIYRLNQEHDLAKLRNFGWQQAQGDWILFLNACEIIDIADAKKLVNIINHSSHNAYYLTVRVLLGNGYYEQNICKLVRKVANIRFQSSLLEDLNESLQQHLCQHLPVKIISHSLKNKSSKAMFEKNMQLLRNDLKKFGKRANIIYQIGMECLKINNIRGAYSHFKHAMNIAGWHYTPELWYYLTHCLIQQKKFSLALQTATAATEIYPDYVDVIYLKGCCQQYMRQLQGAKKDFMRCLQNQKINSKYIHHAGVSDFLAHCRLAEIYFLQGDIKKCFEHYRMAATKPFGNSIAIPALTKLIIRLYGPGAVEYYLTQLNLNSCHSLCLAAISAASDGCLLESLQLWQAAIEKLLITKDIRHYSMAFYAMYKIFKTVCEEAIKNNPQAPGLNYLIEKFDQLLPR